MDKVAAIATIRKLLTEGDIEAALQLLIQNLEPERKQMRNLSNRAIHAKAQLEKAQRDELQGIISFENSKLTYNQITQQVINLVDEWENPAESPAGPRRKFTPQMMLVAFVLLALMGIATFRVIKRNQRAGGQTADTCPQFEPKSMFNIMVLPFSSLNDPENSPQTVHTQIVRRLDRMKEKFAKKIITSIKGKDNPAPETDEDAVQSGENCAAKLVIWGEFEKLEPVEKGTIVTTNYRYLFPDSTFAFTKFGLDEASGVSTSNGLSNIPTWGSFVDTITSLSSITAEGTLTGGLENQFRLLFGVAVMQSGDAKGAIDILQDTEAPDSSSSLLKDMALAESHLQNGDQNAAKEDYRRVLETHPNYWFAINNQALLYYQSGDYAAALETVDKKLQETPNDPAALTIRGAVRIQTHQLKEAKQDLQEAQKSTTDPEKKQDIRKKLDLLEVEKKKEENRKIQALKLLSGDRSNITAMTELAEANRNLGNYQEANQWAEKVLQVDKKNAIALAVKIESAVQLDKSGTRINTAIRKVQELDPATQKAVLEERPVLRSILSIKNH